MPYDVNRKHDKHNSYSYSTDGGCLNTQQVTQRTHKRMEPMHCHPLPNIDDWANIQVCQKCTNFGHVWLHNVTICGICYQNVCLSVWHAHVSCPNGSRYRNLHNLHYTLSDVCNFLNLDVKSHNPKFRWSPGMNALNSGSSLSTPKMWPIMCRVLEIEQDMM